MQPTEIRQVHVKWWKTGLDFQVKGVYCVDLLTLEELTT